MKKNSMDEELVALLKDRKVPILILDAKWHQLFPPDKKPAVIRQLEENVESLMKEQGKLVNELKDLKRAKKKLMDEIVATMGNASEKKKKQSQKLILEMNQRIESETNRIMDLPYEIKAENEKLLLAGMKICYESLAHNAEELQAMEDEINAMRELLKSKVAYKVKIEEEHDKIYECIHDLLGPSIVNLFDRQRD